MPFHTATLANGLQLIGETHPAMRSTAVGFFVRTGARDETDELAGISHFLEHMLFKGTPRRTALQVNLDFDRIGAHYNAYTSEENTVYYAAVLPEYLPAAIDILADILRPSLRQEDFDLEKKVILEEIGMYDDQPTWLAHDLARKLHYGSHPLGNTVLGTKESVSALTREQMHAYFERRYVPSNILVSVAGRFDWSQFVDWIDRHCRDWKPGTAERQHRHEVPGSGTQKVVTKDSVAQEHVLMITGGPPAHSPLRYAAEVLAFAVGDDVGSRLYWELVDPGYAESVDMNYYEYDSNGAFYISMNCDPQPTAHNIALLRQVLTQVQAEGISAEELHKAKCKIATQMVRSSERPMGRMQMIAHAWNYLGEYRDVDTELARYEAVTLDHICELLDRYPLDRPTTLAYGPATVSL